MPNQEIEQFIAQPYEDIVEECEESGQEQEVEEKKSLLKGSTTTLADIGPHVKSTNKFKLGLLTFMFFLQGIPIGLSSSMPLILIANKVSYSDVGTFSFMMWPVSLRILWAPLVDSVYLSKLGRRRTWIFPTTLIIGVIFLTLSDYIKNAIYSSFTNTAGKLI
jgi:hypothetical protein